MTSDVLKAGDKVDIVYIKNNQTKPHIEKPVLLTKIINIKSNGLVQMLMPVQKNKWALLELDSAYQLIFHTKKGKLCCEGKVAERYKTQNLFLVDFELKTPLEKYQRREYFRSQCLIDVKYQIISEEETLRENASQEWEFFDDREIMEGLVVDLSGGGIRMVTKFENTECYILMKMAIENKGIKKEYYLVGSLFKCIKIEDAGRRYENRIKFIGINNRDREEIIRYIFNQERKARKFSAR